MPAAVPIVYTLPECPACARLKSDWKAEGKAFEERAVDSNQKDLDEARKHGDTVPIILYPDGKVEVGYKNLIG